MIFAKLINNEVVLYDGFHTNVDHFISINTTDINEIQALLSQGFKSYREESGEVEGITETEIEIVKTYIPAPVIPLSAYDAFPVKTVLRELKAVFLYDLAGTLSGQGSNITYMVEKKYFNDLYHYLQVMIANGSIDLETYGIIDTIFKNRGIDLSTEPYRN